MAASSGAAIYSERFSGSDASFSNSYLDIGVDTFVAPNFSIGLDAEVGYGDRKGYGATSLRETTSTHYAAGFRLGLNLPLGRALSFYPRLSLGIESNQSDTNTLFDRSGLPAAPSSSSNGGPWASFYAPLLVHPVAHFFVGIGPKVSHAFGAVRGGGPYDGSTATSVGIDAAVGVWWGGASEAPSPPEAAAGAPALASPDALAEAPGAPPEPHFGQRGTVAITSESGASVTSLTYSSTDASNFTVLVEPGLAYFIADGWSLGGAVLIGHSNGTSYDASGTKTDASSDSFGFAARAGLAVPFAANRLSWWPQFEIGWGIATSNQTSPFGSNDHTNTRSWLEGFVPLLVHPTRHVLLGAGPYIFHELSDTDQRGFENDATTVGARFVLGGWL
jgi:hypothetical protein